MPLIDGAAWLVCALLQKGLKMNAEIATTVSAIASAVGALAAAVAVAVYIWQAIEARKARGANGIIELMRLLNSAEAHEARQLVHWIRTPQLVEWRDEQKAAAILSCNVYDLAGILAQRGVVSADLVVEHWGTSIIECFEKTLQMRAGSAGPTRWKNLEALYSRAAVWDSARQAAAR